MSARAIVSVHDVTPAHEAPLRRILSLLGRHDVGRASLLVVPDYHGGWDLRRHGPFADWLRTLEAAGHEIVLHGYQHADPTPETGTRWQRLIRRHYTTEAEFYTLDYADAARRIGAGLRCLQDLGFHPEGFVAPAWLQSEATVRAARDAGLRYFTTLGGFVALREGRRLAARPVCFSSRSLLRARVTAAYGRWRSLASARDEIVRIAVHPGDVGRPGIVAALETALERAARSRRFVSYSDLLERAA